MIKCQNCGTEFEGNFCPRCGTPADGALKPPAAQTTAAVPPQPIAPTMEGESPRVQDTVPLQEIPQPVPTPSGDVPGEAPVIPQPVNSNAGFPGIPQPAQGSGMGNGPVQAPPPMGGTVPPAPGGVPPYAMPVQPPKKKNKTCLIVGHCVGIPILVLIIVGIVVGVVTFKRIAEEGKVNIDNNPGYQDTLPNYGGDSSDGDVIVDGSEDDVVSFEVEGSGVEQNGVTIRVDQIDYASDQTRIYFTVDNQSDYMFYIYPICVTVTVDGIAYSNEYDFSGQFEELPTDIAGGQTASGVIFFPALDPYADMQITIEPFSDDFSHSFSNYEISITG